MWWFYRPIVLLLESIALRFALIVLLTFLVVFGPTNQWSYSAVGLSIQWSTITFCKTIDNLVNGSASLTLLFVGLLTRWSACIRTATVMTIPAWEKLLSSISIPPIASYLAFLVTISVRWNLTDIMLFLLSEFVILVASLVCYDSTQLCVVWCVRQIYRTFKMFYLSLFRNYFNKCLLGMFATYDPFFITVVNLWFTFKKLTIFIHGIQIWNDTYCCWCSWLCTEVLNIKYTEVSIVALF